MCRVPEQTTS